jgi:hypothetical protein
MVKLNLNETEEIEITATFKQSVKGFVREYDFNNQFVVTVKSNEGKTITFDYHISIDETNKGKKVLSDNDHIQAFDSFVNDAISGKYSFDEFMDEYGYTKCKEGYKIWKLCKESSNKYDSLNIDIDLYDLSNIVREKYPDVI